MTFSLTFILALISLFTFSLALPLDRQTGLIHLPLKRLHQPRDDVHPQIFLQQHMNRGFRRLSLMSGATEPSVDELKRNLEKRLVDLGQQLSSRDLGNHIGPDPVSSGMSAPPVAIVTETVTVTISPTSTEKAKPTNPGFSETALKAAQNGGLTPGKPPADASSLALDIEANDVGYIASLQIGSPPRAFKMLMDSGSADMWVGAENCASNEESGGDCGPHTFLGPTSSSTFSSLNRTFSITYGTGSVNGTVIKDDVTFGKGQVLTGHVFGVATGESIEFTSANTPFDGIVGLARSALSEQAALTPIDAMAKDGIVPEPITSYKISRVSDQLNDGQVTFGGLDATKFDPSTLVSVNNVNQQGFWEVEADFTVDGKDIGVKGRTAIMDTGTTLIIAPTADAKAIHDAIPGAKSDGSGGFTLPCTTTATVSLVIGGRAFDINPIDLAFLPVDRNDLKGTCISGITSGRIGGPNEWLVGDVFLKNAYLSTDVKRNTVSFAALV